MPSDTRALHRFDIGHDEYTALVDTATAFWALVPAAGAGGAAGAAPAGDTADETHARNWYAAHAGMLTAEMHDLRFRSRPSAVYFNPTDRCNLDCTYCYIPSETRRNGAHMSAERILEALGRLDAFFERTLPAGVTPQVVFHGSEPLLNGAAVFAAIDAYAGRFDFGVQTNGALLDRDAIEFLTSRGVGIGLSLDGPVAEVADRARRTRNGRGVFERVLEALEALRGYRRTSVICTVTSENVASLPALVDLLHSFAVPACMLNPLRTTMPGSRALCPSDDAFARSYLDALRHSRELFLQSGRKLVVANFANTLLAIVAPAARRLMCDISPCGAGRCFFAVSASGDLYPCSEFLGLDVFRGGNLFGEDIDAVLASSPFQEVASRTTEAIAACATCPVQHYCGAPCPAEAYESRGTVGGRGAFCDFYIEQARFAFRTIADGVFADYLWDDWEEGTTDSYRA